MSKPTLSSGIPLEDLYLREGLVRLDQVFLAHLRQASAELHQRLVVARGDPSSLTEKARSELTIELAPYLEDFLAEQFGITREVAELQARHH